LYRYVSKKDAWLFFWGVFSSVALGWATPLMINYMGDILAIFMNLVNYNILKQNTNIDNDTELNEFVNIIKSNSSSSNNQLIEFNNKHTSLNFTSTIQSIEQIYGNNYSQTISFRTHEAIWDDLKKYLIIYSSLGIITFIVSALSNSLLDIFSTRQGIKIRTLTFKSIMNQEVAWHEKNNPGELLSRLIGDVSIIEGGLGGSLASIIVNLTTFIACYIIAFTNSWLLSLEMGSIIPILIVIFVILIIFLSKYTKKLRDIFAEAGNIALEAISQIKIIAAFGNEDNESQRYKKQLKRARKYDIILAILMGTLLGAVLFIIYCSYWILFRFGTKYIYEGSMTAAQVYKVFLSILSGTSSLTGLSGTIASIAQSTAAAGTVFSIIDRTPKINNEKGEKPKKNLKGDIEFRDVCFSYPSRPEIPILKKISFKCNAGQTIAIVGSSGSGKSTIIQLLERFYEKESGEILIDDIPIENYNIPWLRDQFGIVSQTPVLFEGSIADNIRCTNPTASQTEVENASKDACIHDFIKSLSEGYETNVNERGLTLSGGQKQRICIARAILSNPNILLLDEATSALDNKSEKIVQDALNSVGYNRTTIIIAHRLSTIKNADIILVMDNGEIIETGTHNDLMEKQGSYYNLVKNQNIALTNVDKEIEEQDEQEDLYKMDDDQVPGIEHALSKPVRNSVSISEPKFNSLDRIKKAVNHKTVASISTNASLLEKQEKRRSKMMIQNNNEEEEEIEENEDTDAAKALLKKDLNDDLLKNEEEFSHVRVFKKMHWRRYLNYNKRYWFPLGLGLLGTVINGIVTPFYSYIYAESLNSFNEHGQKLLEHGYFWSSMFIILGLINFIGSALQSCGLQCATACLSYKLRSRMFQSILHQEMGYFDEHKAADLNDDVLESTGSSTNSSGSLTSKLNLEVDLMKGFNGDIADLGKEVITIIVCLAIAIFNSSRLFLILAIVIPFIILSIYLQMKSIRNKNELIRSTFVNSSAVVSEVFINVKTVFELNLQNKYINKYDESLYKPQKSLEHKYIKSNVWSSCTSVAKYIAIIIGYIFTAKYIDNGTVVFAKAYTTIEAFNIGIGSIISIGTIAPTYDKAVEAFGKILEILDRKSKIDPLDESGIKKLDQDSSSDQAQIQTEFHQKEEFFEGNITIKELKFAYPSRPNNVILQFDEINSKIEIPYGKKCGIIGSSGCGKSTFIALLLRWYDPNRGGIYIDDINTKDYNLKWLREKMSIVNQDSSLFNMSVADNIRYGKQNATQEEIEDAAKKANIHDFIQSLPEGYNTIIGSAGTSKMSGGQKQRIAIARAIIRKPKILLLDEATSALDAESELLVQKALDEFSSGRTTIAIAHRLSTLKDFDYLIVIKEGKIEEMGSPKELLEKKGEYYSMVKAGNKN
jgi:ATP-binding cassette subfamily B (MDR/TAP) protein 1